MICSTCCGPAGVVQCTTFCSPSDLLDFAIEPRGAVNATEGDAVVLGCVTGRGAPAPALRWQRDGRPYEGAGRQTVASFGDGGGGGGRTLGGQRSATLRLGAVSDADEGVYRCAATNPLSGEVRLSGEARVTVTGEHGHASPHGAARSTVHSLLGAVALTVGSVPRRIVSKLRQFDWLLKTTDQRN